MTKHKPRRRRARALLVAGAALTLSGCPVDGPFGNLKAPDCDADVTAPFCQEATDMAVEDLPFGNLRADIGDRD